MCGNTRRAGHHQCLSGRGNHRAGATATRGGGISSLITAIQEIKLASHGIDSRAATGYGTMPATSHAAQPLDTQTQGVERGVIYDDENGSNYPSATDEKKQLQEQETVHFEELPSYEASKGVRSESSASSVAGEPVYTPATSEASYNHHTMPQAHPQTQEAHAQFSRYTENQTQTPLLSNLELFRTSLLSYSQGAHGAKKDAKHAAKSFVRDLRAQEVARIRGEGGYLNAGERKQMRRELRPVKEMLKGAVWEAKQERKGRY